MFWFHNFLFKERNGQLSECVCRSIHINGDFFNTTLLVFCFLGIVFNWMSLLVLMNKEHKLPIFTYLTVYTTMDLLHTIMLSGYVIVEIYLKSTVLFRMVELLENYCTEVLNTIRIIAMLSITIDRLRHLEMILKLRPTEKNSSRARARLVMVVTFVLCICANLPNLLVYKCQEVFLDPDFEYLRSRFYISYNWIYFPLFYILPCFLLIIGNIRLIILLRRAVKMEHSYGKTGRRRNFNLTITATVIILTFVVVQIPGYLAIRPHLVSMSPPDLNEEVLRILDSLIELYRFVPALNSFANFFIYILLCPPFKRSFVKTLMVRKRKCGIGSSIIHCSKNERETKGNK